MHMRDRSRLRVALQRQLIQRLSLRAKRGGPKLSKGGLQRAEGLEGGLRPRMFIDRQNRRARLGIHQRHQAFAEAALPLGLRGTMLRLQREAVDFLAAEPLERRDQIGADALWNLEELLAQLKIVAI